MKKVKKSVMRKADKTITEGRAPDPKMKKPKLFPRVSPKASKKMKKED